jgi:DNA-binding CsgD family transcriptional regulator
MDIPASGAKAEPMVVTANGSTPSLEQATRTLLDSVEISTGRSEDATGQFDVTLSGVRYVVTIAAVAADPARSLTPREREIVRMISEGYTNKMVAAVLDISLWTVSTHIRRIFSKLGVSTRAAMVARAAAHPKNT